MTANFQIFSGEMHIDVAGPDVGQYDRVVVGGYAAMNRVSGPNQTLSNGGKVAVGFTPKLVKAIEPNTTFTFLTRANQPQNSSFVTEEVPYNLPTWAYGRNATSYWITYSGQRMEKVPGQVGGKVWNDANGVLAGIREAGEGGIQGAAVRLFDAAGANQVAATTTDADGSFLFEDIAAGIYLAEVDLPAGKRLVAANVGSADTDSDFDPTTRRVRFEMYDDVANLDAGLFANSVPTAATDIVLAHKNTPAVGNVRLNDTDANDDPLTVALAGGPTNGTLVLNSDGSFTYTPNANYSGPDQFTYTASDGYGTSTGTVNMTVASTSPPVGAGDSYALRVQE